jgi:hypothetical protein
MITKKIFIFNSTPFTKRDFIRFGGEIFKKNGFDVWFYDFSPIVYPELHKNCTFPDLYYPENHILFLNEREALKVIAELPPDSIVLMIPRFDSYTHKIFQALTKTNIPYCVAANHSFPIWEKPEPPKFSKLIKTLFSLNIITLKKIIYRPQIAPLLGIRKPALCIVAGDLSLERNKTKYLVSENTEILWAHTLDYDIYLKSKTKNLTPPDNNGVFLDPLAPQFLGDTLAFHIEGPTTVENYYPSICKFFNLVEKELGLSIKIAAHPKSNHPPYPDYFGGRETLRGDSFGMIERSRFVIAQSSTAIQFAILLKKPILFLTTNEIETDKIFSEPIRTYANSLEKTVINIDTPLTIHWEKELYVDEKKYDAYIERYIKKRGTEELNTWQILANRLKHF